jgi:hypothetical protein
LSERVLAIELLLKDDPRNSIEFDEGDQQPPPNGRRLNRIRDLTYYLARMRPLAEASALRGALRRSGIESADFALFQLFWPSEDAAHPWTVYLARPISSMIDSCFLGEARASAADAALAVLLYRRATGQTPRQLAGLVPAYLPAVPLDPFNGEPLRYRIEEARCAIYSVAPDRIDNDGAVFTELDKPYDVAFWLSFENPTPQVP